MARGGLVEPREEDTVYDSTAPDWTPEAYSAALRKAEMEDRGPVGYQQGGEVAAPTQERSPLGQVLDYTRKQFGLDLIGQPRTGYQERGEVDDLVPTPRSDPRQLSRDAGVLDIGKQRYGSRARVRPASLREERQATGGALAGAARSVDPEVFSEAQQGFPESRNVVDRRRDRRRPRTGYQEGGVVEATDEELRAEEEIQRELMRQQARAAALPAERAEPTASREQYTTIRETPGPTASVEPVPPPADTVVAETREYTPVARVRDWMRGPAQQEAPAQAPADMPLEAMTGETGFGTLLTGAARRLGRNWSEALAAEPQAEQAIGGGRSVLARQAPPSDQPAIEGGSSVLGAGYKSMKEALASYASGDGGFASEEMRTMFQEARAANPRLSHNDLTQSIFDNFMARKDFDGASRTVQALRQPYGQARAVAQAALAQGNIDVAVQAFSAAHDILPNKTNLSLKSNPDGTVTATVVPEGGGDAKNYNLTREQFRQWGMGPGSDFEHLAENGTSNNFAIAARQPGQAGYETTGAAGTQFGPPNEQPGGYSVAAGMPGGPPVTGYGAAGPLSTAQPPAVPRRVGRGAGREVDLADADQRAAHAKAREARRPYYANPDNPAHNPLNMAGPRNLPSGSFAGGKYDPYWNFPNSRVNWGANATPIDQETAKEAVRAGQAFRDDKSGQFMGVTPQLQRSIDSGKIIIDRNTGEVLNMTVKPYGYGVIAQPNDQYGRTKSDLAREGAIPWTRDILEYNPLARGQPPTTIRTQPKPFYSPSGEVESPQAERGPITPRYVMREGAPQPGAEISTTRQEALDRFGGRGRERERTEYELKREALERKETPEDRYRRELDVRTRVEQERTERARIRTEALADNNWLTNATRRANARDAAALREIASERNAATQMGREFKPTPAQQEVIDRSLANVPFDVAPRTAAPPAAQAPAAQGARPAPSSVRTGWTKNPDNTWSNPAFPGERFDARGQPVR